MEDRRAFITTNEISSHEVYLNNTSNITVSCTVSKCRENNGHSARFFECSDSIGTLKEPEGEM